jgi:hypothetical protein
MKRPLDALLSSFPASTILNQSQHLSGQPREGDGKEVMNEEDHVDEIDVAIDPLSSHPSSPIPDSVP